MSTIASAIIVPGLGQVLNGQLKKGLIIMSVVFIFITAGIIRIVNIVMKLLPQIEGDAITQELLKEKVHQIDFSSIRIIIVILAVVWVYSIYDAFATGRRLEREGKEPL